VSARLRLKLDDQLCFALYAATNAVTRAYRPLLDEVGLTYPQYLVMMVLWQGGSRTSGYIAERLHLAPNALTPMLDRLEQGGLLTRRRDDQDRRLVHIALTPSGVQLESAAARAQRAVVCQTELEADALIALRDELKALVLRMEPASDPATRDGR
jgi:DNA-binding MarR family transcriptional regulator